MRTITRAKWMEDALARAGNVPGVGRLIERFQPEPRWKRVSRRALPFVATGGASVVAAYLLDPDQGRSRRARMKDEIAGMVRRSSRRARRTTRKLRSDAHGYRRRP